MTYQLVHVQPSDKDAKNLLYIANATPEQAVEFVRKNVPADWEVLLSEGSISEELASQLNLADGDIREFDQATAQMGHR